MLLLINYLKADRADFGTHEKSPGQLFQIATVACPQCLPLLPFKTPGYPSVFYRQTGYPGV